MRICELMSTKRDGYRNLVGLVLVAGLASGLAMAPTAMGQDIPTAAPAPAATVTQPAADKDGKIQYVISRFLIDYERPSVDHPSVEDLGMVPVLVGVLADGGFTFPRDGIPTKQVRVGDFFGEGGQVFYGGGIKAVTQAITAELTERRMLVGVSVAPDASDIDWNNGADKRGGRKEFKVRIFTATVGGTDMLVQTPNTDPDERLNPQRLERIRMSSPLNVGNLVRRDLLDDYMLTLNRHPGRRINAALVPSSDKPGEVTLQYQIVETKPWSVYMQVANIGTEKTGEWRERLGFFHNQLTDNDDVLRVDYMTSGFTESSNALSASYDRPIFGPDVRLKIYGSWSQFTSDDIGVAGQSFEGENWNLGAELSATLLQSGPAFLDAIGGVRYDSVKVSNTLLGSEGEEKFLFPYVGLRFERTTDTMSSNASVTAEYNTLSPDTDELIKLGRFSPDDSYTIVKYEAGHSMYLEPLLIPKAFKDKDEFVKGTTLAHEVYVGLRGQTALGSRIIPTFQTVAGGLYSVRGYPESVAAGDDSIVGTLEYRFHLPRTLLTTGKDGRVAYMDPSKTQFFGSPFRVGPTRPFDTTDWDLIFKGFLDVGRTRYNDRFGLFEQNNTLVGAGVGVEFQLLQNFNLRVDWGFALHDVDGTERVDSGDSRVHISATLLY